MFQEFNESTIMYYTAIRKEDCEKVYQDFNKATLLEIHGEKYKKAYYPKEI